MRFEREASISNFLMGYCRWLLADIPEEQMSRQPGAEQHSAVWILGHLAITNDHGLASLERCVCPPSWAVFNPGGPADAAPSPAPCKLELIDTLDTSRQRLLAAMEQAPADRLAQPHSVSFFRDCPLKTVTDALAFLALGHVAMHLGQLSSWRRQMGRPSLF